MPAGAASRYALGAHGVGAVRPAPAASLISASRYALGARRSARRGRAARLCAAGGAAVGCHRRLALRARRRWRGRCAPGRLWQPGRRLALRARRRRHGRCAPGRLHVFPPPITCARCLLVMGTSKTSCASRCSGDTTTPGATTPGTSALGHSGQSSSKHPRMPAVQPSASSAVVCRASRLRLGR